MDTEEHVGRVREYRHETQAANVQVEHGHLELGDVLHFHGHDVDFEEAITSMRQDRQPVQAVHEGQSADIWVRRPVPEGSEVRRVKDPYEDGQAELLGRFFGRTGPTGEGAGQGETM